MRSSVGRALASACLMVAAAFAPRAAHAQEPAVADAPAAPTLARLLDLADRNHPNLAQARAKLLQARAQLDEARYAPFSIFRASGGVALAPTVRGTDVFSPNTDVSLTSSLGVGWRATVEGLVPLWTFGKITNLWDAAEANVKVNQASLEVDRDAIHYDVRRAYFGLQLARDATLLLKDVREELDKAAGRLKASVDKGEGDEIELLKLQTNAAELEIKESEAAHGISVALAGLRFLTGIPNLEVPDAPLRAPRHRLGHVSRYLTAARLYRPEIAMARAGVRARGAQLEIARAKLFPDIGIGLTAGISAAPEVADQINPYVNDPGNYFHYGAGLVFNWSLDFLPQAARIRYAEAQLEEVRSQERYALGGTGFEVESAYADVVDWKRRLAAYEKAAGYAKKWLITVQQGLDVGTMEDKDVLEPAKTYALQKSSVLIATMELDLAMSRLAKATGWDAIAPDGT